MQIPIFWIQDFKEDTPSLEAETSCTTFHETKLMSFNPSLDGIEGVINYLGKLFNVGTWQERWNTLGHFSQQRSSPPFWHTAHQSSLGSSSFLPSPMWGGPIHPVFPLDVFSCSIPGWSSVLSGASVLKTASSEVELWLLSNSNEVRMLLEKVACKKKQRKTDFNIYVNLHDPNDK